MTSINLPDPLPRVGLPPSKSIHDVRKWATAVLQSFGLAGWYITITRAVRQLGVCRFRLKTIGLSRHLIERNSGEDVRETLLHEIAHAFAGPRAGHGPVWRDVARRLGCRPERCGAADMPKGRWRARCGGCSREFFRHRRPKRLTGCYCLACGPERGMLVWGESRPQP